MADRALHRERAAPRGGDVRRARSGAVAG
jgi:hypothetical protein